MMFINMLMNLWKFIVHAVRTLVVCVDKEILRPQTCSLLDLKTLERGGVECYNTLYQTHETSLQDWSIYQATAQTVNMNIDYHYKFFTAVERRAFLVEHFGAQSKQVRAYDMLADGTSQSDVFRICLLYLRGGVYMDCKGATIHPFNTFIPTGADLTLFVDTYATRVTTSFIASTPKNPLISRLMDEAVNRVLEKRFGENHLDVAGPEMFGTVVRDFLGLTELRKGRYVSQDGTKVHLIGTTNFFNTFMFTRDDLPVIKRQPDTYFFSIKKLVTRYEWSWISGRYFLL